MSTAGGQDTTQALEPQYHKFCTDNRVADTPDLRKQFIDCIAVTQQFVNQQSEDDQKYYGDPNHFGLLLRMNMAKPPKVSAVSKSSDDDTTTLPLGVANWERLMGSVSIETPTAASSASSVRDSASPLVGTTGTQRLQQDVQVALAPAPAPAPPAVTTDDVSMDDTAGEKKLTPEEAAEFDRAWARIRELKNPRQLQRKLQKELSNTGTRQVSLRTPMPPTFAGRDNDRGACARLWLDKLTDYLNLEAVPDELRLVNVAPFFEGEAYAWYKLVKTELESKAGFGNDVKWSDFAAAFIAQYVSSEDSDNARAEMRKLYQQGDTVELYWLKFQAIINRITVGERPDKATQADSFKKGLNTGVVDALANRPGAEHAVRNVDALAKLAIETDKALRALGRAHVGNTPAVVQGVNKKKGKQQVSGNAYAQAPQTQQRHPQQSQRGRSRGPPGYQAGHIPRGQQAHAVHQANTVPEHAGNTGRRGKHPSQGQAYAGPPRAEQCCQRCGEWGHIALDCWAPPAAVDAHRYRLRQRGVSYLIRARQQRLGSAHWKHIAECTEIHCNVIGCKDDQQAAMQAQQCGSPPAAAFNSSKHTAEAVPFGQQVNVLSAGGQHIILPGVAAVLSNEPEDKKLIELKLRVLSDPGATHSYIDSKLVQQYNLHVKSDSQVLTVANNAQVQTAGAVVVNLSFNAEDGTLVKTVCMAYVLNLPPGFDMLIGQDFNQRYGVNTLNEPDMGCTFLSPASGSKVFIPCISPQRTTPCKDTSISCHTVSYSTLCEELRDEPDDTVWLYRVVQADPTESPYSGHVACNVNSAQQIPDIIQAALDRHPAVFPEDMPTTLPPERSVFHTIPLKLGAEPFAQRPSRMSRLRHEECLKQIEDGLAKGIIQPSASAWGAPVLFVEKKDGTLRMCNDYRRLNAATIKDKFPLPRIDDLYDQLQGAAVFTSLDLRNAYHQVRLKPDDVHKTGFTTPFGHYEYKVLCFGLCNAPATFQRFLSDVLKPYLGKFCLVYLDDIIIYSHSMEEHAQHLELVLALLEQHQLYAKLSKCTFAQPELLYLGHVISGTGMRPDPAKVARIQNWPQPRTVAEVRSFLGFANYFRRYIDHYAHMVKPLNDLLRKDNNHNIPQAWNPACSAAFQGVKQALCSEPVLRLADPDKPFEVVTDACAKGIGAVLLQEGHPIAYEGRMLTPAEENYETHDQEMLAVIHALKVWSCYLEGAKHKFTVVTDNSCNTFFSTKTPLSKRQARWMVQLQDYDFDWQYRKGANNMADPISRLPAAVAMVVLHMTMMESPQLNESCMPNSTVYARRTSPQQTASQQVALLAHMQLYASRTRAATASEAQETPEADTDADSLSDPNNLLAEIMSGYTSDPWFQTAHSQRDLSLRDGLWWKNNVSIVVPANKQLQQHILRELHEANYAGHPGTARTQKLVERLYWWPSIRQDIADYVKTCPACQRNKSTNQKPAGLLQPLPIPERPYSSVSMDLITDLPKTARGHTAIWVVVDRLTKMCRFVPTTKQCTAADTAELLWQHVFSKWGPPDDIISDRDPRLSSKFMRTFCKLLGTRQRMSTAFHPQTDGQTERMNRVLEDYLRHYVEAPYTDWDLHMATAEFAINNAHNESIGNTPYFLCHGFHPRLPPALPAHRRNLGSTAVHNEGTAGDAPAAYEHLRQIKVSLTAAKVALDAAQQRQKASANKRRRDLQFAVDDTVKLDTRNLRILAKDGSRKLMPRYYGPLHVVERIGTVAYKLKLPTDWRIHDVFHVSLLQPWNGERDQATPTPITVDGEDWWLVEMVLDHRPKHYSLTNAQQRRKMEFFVDWKGCKPTDRSWEPHSLVKDLDALQDYWSKLGAEAQARAVYEQQHTPTPAGGKKTRRTNK